MSLDQKDFDDEEDDEDDDDEGHWDGQQRVVDERRGLNRTNRWMV